MPAPPTASELLARYGLTDPGRDVDAFALQVRQLADSRRAVLNCKAEATAGWHLVMRFFIWGTDSTGLAITSADESPLQVLANIIRELNRRYAERLRDSQSS